MNPMNPHPLNAILIRHEPGSMHWKSSLPDLDNDVDETSTSRIEPLVKPVKVC